MPTYEYRCSHCLHEFEETQSIKDSPLVACPKCNLDRLYRIIGAGGGTIFKGSGFYKTDYKKAGSSKNEGSTEQKSDKPKTESSPAEKKAETKTPDAKTDSSK